VKPKYLVLPVVLGAAFTMSGCSSLMYMGQHESVAYGRTSESPLESTRDALHSIAVIAAPGRPELRVEGDYGEATPTVGEGAAGGAAAGVAFTGEAIAEDPRALIFAPILLPAAMIAGSIAGAAGAKIEKELAEFREGLAEELGEDTQRLSPTAELATALAERIDRIPDKTIVAQGADASLEIEIDRITITTHDKDATVTTDVRAVLRGADGHALHTQMFRYAEKDLLRNWARDNGVAWDRYAQQAYDYLAAEISADLFETVLVRHVLRPTRSKTFTGDWKGRARSDRPQLAWELFLLGGDDFDGRIDETRTTWDLRIFDDKRLFHEATGITGTSYTLPMKLPTCDHLIWSVRPVYDVGGRQRAGEWMNLRSNFDRINNNEVLDPYPATQEAWAYYAKLRTRCAS